MTGRQIYNYLLTAAGDGLELYASGFWRDASLFVKDVQLGERVYLLCSKVEEGEEQSPPMKAGRLFKKLHAFLDSAGGPGGPMEKDVFARTRPLGNYATISRAVAGVDEVPCYKGRALCFATSPATV